MIRRQVFHIPSEISWSRIKFHQPSSVLTFTSRKGNTFFLDKPDLKYPVCHAVWSCVPYAPSQTCCVVLALFLVAFEGQSGVCLLIYAFCWYLSVPGTGDTEGVEGNLQNFPVKLRSQNLLRPPEAAQSQQKLVFLEASHCSRFRGVKMQLFVSRVRRLKWRTGMRIGTHISISQTQQQQRNAMNRGPRDKRGVDHFL